MSLWGPSLFTTTTQTHTHSLSTWLDIRSTKRHAAHGSVRASLRLTCRVVRTFLQSGQLFLVWPRCEEKKAKLPAYCWRLSVIVNGSALRLLLLSSSVMWKNKFLRFPVLMKSGSSPGTLQEFDSRLELVRYPVLLTELRWSLSLSSVQTAIVGAAYSTNAQSDLTNSPCNIY